MSSRDTAERTVRDIRRKTRKQYSAEEKIRIVVSGLRGEDSLGRVLDTPLRLSLSVLAADTLDRGIKRAKGAHSPASHLPPWVVA